LWVSGVGQRVVLGGGGPRGGEGWGPSGGPAPTTRAGGSTIGGPSPPPLPRGPTWWPGWSTARPPLPTIQSTGGPHPPTRGRYHRGHTQFFILEQAADSNKRALPAGHSWPPTWPRAVSRRYCLRRPV